MTLALARSSEAWVRAACGDLDLLLVDHAHCEKKAASTALRWIFRYVEWPSLVSQLSRLAREELVHFERVLGELKARNVALRPLSSSGYAAALFAEAHDVADQLLVCALIEARSHERFERLTESVPDARLRSFYAELAEAEARHGDLYLELAGEAAGSLHAASVAERLADLARREQEILVRADQPLRMHSG